MTAGNPRMERRIRVVREGVVVTVGGLVALVVSFVSYLLVFRLMEDVAGPEGHHGFVPVVRVGTGAVWIGLCLAAYRSGIPDLVKACVLTGSLATFMVALGVQSYEHPVLVVLIVSGIPATSVLLLLRRKKGWYHYYAVALSVVAAIVYL